MDGPRDEQDRDSAWPLTITLAVLAGLIRLIPHPLNLTPVGALGLFAGARLRLRAAVLVPVAVMVGSDLLLWALHGYSPFDPFVYVSFLLNVALGHFLLRQGGGGRIAVVSVIGSLQFFLLTNFGVWLALSVDPAPLPNGAAVEFRTVEGIPLPVPVRYARNPAGLASCYAAAWPIWQTNAPPLGFLGNQLAGDLIYCALLFGLSALLRRGLLNRRRSAAPAAPLGHLPQGAP
jgi:hypothetical protein